MRVQPIVLTLAIGALVLPLAPARAAQGSGGHASGGHAASASGGHATTARARAGTEPNRSTVASRGGVRNARSTVRRATGPSTNGMLPPPPTPGMPLPNPVVVGSAALLGPAPGGDKFRAGPNTYGRHPGSRSIVGAGFVGGPWFYGSDVAEPAADEMTGAAPVASAPAEPTTIIAAGPPETDGPDDLHRHGEIRFDVEPLAAQVFADGEPRGTVGDFYHSLLGLSLVSGGHHLEFRAPGYETTSGDVTVIAGRTIVYKLAMKRSK